MKHTVREELKGILAFVGVIWVVFFVDLALPADLTDYGVTPRTASGLFGVPLMPFLHASFQHLTGNTLPLVVLLGLLAGSRARSWETVILVVLFGGLLLWVCGRHATHVGASGLVFGLIAFLIVAGILERRFVPLMVSVLVGFLFGGSLLAGIVPQPGSHVSWDGHLCGAVAGGGTAWLLARNNAGRGRRRRRA